MKPRLVVARGKGAENRREVGVAIKGQHEGSLRCEILYFDCININFLVDIILWFIRCYHWEKLGQRVHELSVLFLITTWDSTIISKNVLLKKKK